jgi:hypothetical protein
MPALSRRPPRGLFLASVRIPSMKQVGLLLALAAFASSAAAKDKLIPLADADVAGLQGKTVALTLHDRPSFAAFTSGKAMFGLFGAGAMIAAGNHLIQDNNVADPAGIVRTNLANELASAYGVKLLAADTTPIKVEKPKEVAATHPDADFVLDVRTGGWMYIYFPSDWTHYWMMYSVQVQLIDTKTGRQVSNAACNAGTKDHKNPPTHDQLYANGAQLVKDMTASLGWTCVGILARDQLHIPASNWVAVPAQYVDPLAALAAAPAPAASQSSAPSAPAVPSDAAAAVSVTPDNSVATPVQAPAATDATAPASNASSTGGNN